MPDDHHSPRRSPSRTRPHSSAPATTSASAPAATAEPIRYGSGGEQLCQWCMATAKEQWDARVHYTSTRG
ncbi:hypothetical protein [Streptomyces sp. NPDC051001]|uniref:hypothetical protein n=1 Tax=Streptomyces sp. NPDC051001 TaxID=3155795 RepID=UPI0034461E2C